MPEYRDVVADIPDEDTLHLVRANYMADTVGDVLKQAGVPFKNARWGVRWTDRMYRLYNATAALVRAVADSADEFETPDYSEVSASDARHLVKPLPADMFAGRKRATRKLDALDATDGDGFGEVDLKSWFDVGELLALLDAPTPFDAMNPSGVGSEDVRERLKEAWRVRDGAPIGDLTHTITTIHGAKGAEADTVFLYDASTKRIQRDADPTAEARVWFVGATRAKNRLYVVSSDAQHRQPLPEVGG
jgi:superfamily I DNA/RNA helicase